MGKNIPYLFLECSNESLEQDLLQLGIIPGTSLTLVEHKYSKDALCVEVNNSRFAFRKASAKHIWVKRKTNEQA